MIFLKDCVVGFGWACELPRSIRGVTNIGAWYEYGYFHRLLRRVLEGAPIIEKPWGTLMVFKGFESRPRSPEGCRARSAEPKDILRVVEVVNKAFSIYDWFEK